MWVSQVTAPLFAKCRPRCNDMVIPYLRAIISEAESIILGEKFLEQASEKFGAGVEEVVEEDHDDLEVLCDCEFSLAYGNRVLLHNTTSSSSAASATASSAPTARASRP